MWLGRAARDLEACAKELDVADIKAVHAREHKTLAYAKAFLEAQGSMEVRRQIAMVESGDARLSSEVADQIVRGLKTRMDVLKTRIDTGRSIGAAVRTEMKLGDIG